MIEERPNVNLAGLYPLSRVADLLGVRRTTVYRWLDSGVFHTSEISRRKYGRQEIVVKGSGILRVWGAK